MQTDQELEWPFELFVMDHKGKVYRLHSPSRHVPRLGGHTPFCIIPPRPILADHGVWNNNGLHKCYTSIRVAIPGVRVDSRDPRLSGKIPLAGNSPPPPPLQLGVSTFIPVPEHLRTKGDITSICISGKAASARPLQPITLAKRIDPGRCNPLPVP